MTDHAVPGPLYAVALTRAGAALAARLAAAFPGTRAFAPGRFAIEHREITGFEEPTARLVERLWPGARGFFLVMAAGIAVRNVAPLLTDKTTDPAVVVLDPAGRFAVPILSGHLGGANELAREVGRRLGATPVITTATDASGRPAVEVWAREQGLRTEGREGIVAINAAWANGEPVGAYSDPALGRFARDALKPLVSHLALQTEDEAQARAFGGALLAVSHRELPDLGAALFVRPPCLALGVGCRRGAAPEVVEQGVREALAGASLSARAVAVVATVDAKGDEPALHSLAQAFGVELHTFRAAALSGMLVPTPSARVKEAVGTPSVAEAAALAASSGTLILPKVKGRVWTLAVAVGAPVSCSGFSGAK